MLPNTKWRRKSVTSVYSISELSAAYRHALWTEVAELLQMNEMEVGTV